MSLRAGAPAALVVKALLTGLASLVAVSSVTAAGTAARTFTVTDVTPRSFQVVWLSSEPAYADLRLFAAPDCALEILDATVTPLPTRSGDPSIGAAARQKGIMVVIAAGLTPDTEYCVRTVTTSVASGQVLGEPSPTLRVKTARATTRGGAPAGGNPGLVAFSNDLAKFAVVTPVSGGLTPGALVLLKIAGASSPLSAFVGDAVDDDNDPNTPTNLALFDLNNLYDSATGASLDLRGDGTEVMSAVLLGGPQGIASVHARLVPTETQLNAVVVPSACAGAPQTACDGILGDANNDGLVSLADADVVRNHVVSLMPILPCAVCADVTWDLATDMKDALAIGQAAAGLRMLLW